MSDKNLKEIFALCWVFKDSKRSACWLLGSTINKVVISLSQFWMMMMIKSLIHLLFLLPAVIATQPEPINGELVVVYQVDTDGVVSSSGKPHVVIVAEEDDEVGALLLEGFDFDDAEVMSLCPVEAACARSPAVTTITVADVVVTTGTGGEEGNGSNPSPPQDASGDSQSQAPPPSPIARSGKNNTQSQVCLEVVVVRGEERCVVWKGKAREDGSSQRIVHNRRVDRA
jgi:hypothetical protein